VLNSVAMIAYLTTLPFFWPCQWFQLIIANHPKNEEDSGRSDVSDTMTHICVFET
jgi:hypothetical protein